MDHDKMLNQLQLKVADALQRPTVTLGEVTIVSALLTEFATTLILFEEVYKFQEFNENITTPCEKIEFNKALAEVLKGVCCIENAIVEKMRAGMEMDGIEVDPEPIIGDCCKR
ncbi:hypothetical protein DVB69_06915 [Sporosarcina sp. BI001-red]|uniref:hypothetical protein n=1 Tax=Sporosarcina sp. BI001-red TaxID=2282866 RepID=UPI000E221B7F|nr:hypothetical protein [Sporosarcina sp. BI001-red]REB08846.1 hypothetical protein DVB69_06915 [Sporosarcina sp. BI001-red]